MVVVRQSTRIAGGMVSCSMTRPLLIARHNHFLRTGWQCPGDADIRWVGCAPSITRGAAAGRSTGSESWSSQVELLGFTSARLAVNEFSYQQVNLFMVIT